MFKFELLMFLLVATIPALLIARKASCKMLTGRATRGDVIAYAMGMGMGFSFLGMVSYLVTHPLILG